MKGLAGFKEYIWGYDRGYVMCPCTLKCFISVGCGFGLVLGGHHFIEAYRYDDSYLYGGAVLLVRSKTMRRQCQRTSELSDLIGVPVDLRCDMNTSHARILVADDNCAAFA